MKRPIEECWNIYANGVLPPDTPTAKREALRSAFYCGMYSMRQLFAAAGQTPDKEEGRRTFREIMDEADAELREFIEWNRDKAAQLAREKEGGGDEKKA